MTNTDRVRCENLTCLCEVPLGQPACAPYCGSPEARDAHKMVCECGHAGCMEQSRRRLHGESGKESL